MRANTTQHKTPSNVENLLDELEDYINLFKVIKMEVLHTFQPASTSTSSRLKESTDKAQARVVSDVTMKIKSFISKANTFLELLSQHSNTTNASATANEDATANDAIANEDATGNQSLVRRSRRSLNKNTRMAREKTKQTTILNQRLRSNNAQQHLEEDTNEDDDEDEDDNETIPERQIIADRHEGDQAGGRLSRKHNPSNDAIPPSEPDQSGTNSADVVFTVRTGMCELMDLGRHTVPTLEKFVRLGDVQRTGMCHLQVSGFSLEDLDFDPRQVQDASRTATQIKCNTTSFMQTGIMTISSHSTVPPTEPCPAFTDAPRIKYSDGQLVDIFESFCTPETTSRPQWYLIGPTEEVLGERYHNLDLLNSGPYMEQTLNAVIEGVNSTYIYASYSQGQTATAMHCEDCHWGSVNLMLCGAPKLWLSVEPESNKVLEAGLSGLFPEKMTACSQRVRHLDVFLAPSLLRQLGVKYHIKACYPGELIFTTLPTYHQIINMGANMAAATNFMDRETPGCPKDYVLCSRGICGFTNSVGPRHFRSPKRSWSEDMATESPSSKKNCNKVTTAELGQLQRYNLGLSEHIFHTLVPKGPASILASILSRPAVITLVKLLSMQRLEHYHEPEKSIAHPSSSQDFARKAAAYHHAAKSSLDQADLSLLCERVNAYIYACVLEEKKDGRQQLTSDLVTAILKEQKIVATAKTRQNLLRDFSIKKKWLSFCKILGPGLLALLPLQSISPYHLSKSTITKMTEDDIAMFNKLLMEIMEDSKVKKILESLCAIADGLVKRITYNTIWQYGLTDTGNIGADFEYHSEWVHGNIFVLSEDGHFDLEDALSALTPRPYLIQNRLAQEQLDCRSITDPTLIPKAKVSCTRAAATERCACMRPLSFNLCRRCTESSNKRPTIRSCVTFTAGDTIGELTGMLYSTEHENCSGTFCALSWPDQLDSSIGHLHWEDFGNWVRLVPHSCDPCAEFAPRIEGCRLRIMLDAKTAIARNAHITVDWRLLSGYAGDKLQQCICCKGPCSKL
jgi:hypothetical protein